METNKKLIEELYQEINSLKKDKEDLRSKNLNYANKLSELSGHIKGIGCLVNGLVNMQNMNEELFCNSCGALSLSLEQISISMEDRS